MALQIEALGIDFGGLTALTLASNNIKSDSRNLPLHRLAVDRSQLANKCGREDDLPACVRRFVPKLPHHLPLQPTETLVEGWVVVMSIVTAMLK